MASVGIRDLKNQLSRYVRRVAAGESVSVTDRGRVVAELVPPSRGAPGGPSGYERLVAAGVVRPALEQGDPLYRLSPAKVAAAQRILGTPTATETIEAALDMVVFRNELIAGTRAMLGVELAPPDSQPAAG